MSEPHPLPLLPAYSPPLQMLLREALRYRARVSLYLALLLAGALLNGGKFLLLEQLVRSGMETAWGRAGELFAATASCWLLGQAAAYASVRVGLQFERSIGITVVRRALRDLLDRAVSGVGQIGPNNAVQFLRTALRTVSHTLHAMLLTVSQAFTVAAAVAVAFWLQPLLAGGCLLVGVLGLIWTARHIHQRREGANEALAAERQLHDRLCRMFEALPQMKVYGAGEGQLPRLLAPLQRQKRADQHALHAQRQADLKLNLLAAATGLVVLLGAVFLLQRGEASVPQVATLLAIHLSIFAGLGQMLRGWASAEENRDQVAALLESPYEATPEPATAARLDGPIDTIECEEVEFTVGEVTLLSGVTCRLQRGRLYGVAGPSGSGKTMLLHLLGLGTRPSGGQLKINGLGIEQLDREDLGRRVVLVTWPPLLLEGQTLADNLRVARPEVTEEELREAIRMAGLGGDVAQLEPVGGLGCRLGCGHVQLSVGQLQRLALARAFLRAPEVLLVDDLLTGLDPASTLRVLKSLRFLAKRYLVVLAAPYEAVREWCDELLITADGRLAGQVLTEHVQDDPAFAGLLDGTRGRPPPPVHGEQGVPTPR